MTIHLRSMLGFRMAARAQAAAPAAPRLTTWGLGYDVAQFEPRASG